MENNSVVVVTPAELRRIVSEEVNNVLPKLADFRRKHEPVVYDSMNAMEAAQFLSQNGYPTTRASLYNLVSRGVAPYRKIGRRVIFSRKDLVQWLVDNTETPETQENAAKRIAASANRKKS